MRFEEKNVNKCNKYDISLRVLYLNETVPWPVKWGVNKKQISTPKNTIIT